MDKDTQIVRRIETNALLQAAVEKGASVETLERLLALAKEVRQEQAREAFNHAFAEFQSKCPQITKSKTANITSPKGSKYSYSYTPLEDIMEKIVPVMSPLGLSVSYRMGFQNGRVSAVAILSHELGHAKESGEVEMPVPTGGTGANPAQCVGIASTYARRYALLAVTGISPQAEDPDGQTEEDDQSHTEFQKAHEKLKQNDPTGKPDPAGKEQDASATTPAPADRPTEPKTHPSEPSGLISVPQQKRLYAIAKNAGWKDEDMKRALVGQFGYKSSKEIKKDHYDTICLYFEGGGKPAEAEPRPAENAGKPDPTGQQQQEDIPW